MRAEDKQLEGIDLEREEEFQREHAAEDELLEVAGEEVLDVELRDMDRERRSVLLGAIRAIFERDTVRISGLGLPKREEQALDYLQAAVSGRETLGAFVYASDRRDLLEQALAVLQPNLTNADPELLAVLGSLDTLTGRLGELRGELSQLEDAQDEIIANDRLAVEETHADDKPDAPADAEPLADVAEPGEAPVMEWLADALLSLHDVKAESVTPSTLVGDELPEAPPSPSTLEGDERPDEPRPPSVYDDDAPPAPKVTSKPVAATPPGKPARPGRGGRLG